MLNAPIQLHRNHRLIHDSARFMEKAEALLAQSRALGVMKRRFAPLHENGTVHWRRSSAGRIFIAVTYGKARAVARARASLTYEEALTLSEQRHETHPVQTVQCRCDPERYAAHIAHGIGSFMKITSTTNLEFPRLKFSIRQGEVKDLPADPEAAAIILASAYVREVPGPEC